MPLDFRYSHGDGVRAVPMVALKHCLDKKCDMKEKKQSVPWCSFLYPLGWFQQAGVLTLMGTLQQYLGQVPEGSCSPGLPSSRSVRGQCECWGICTSSQGMQCVKSCSMCLWESGQPEGKGLRKEYDLTCSELMNAALEVFSGRPWIPAGYTMPSSHRLSRVLQLECLGCDWSPGPLAIPILKRAVSGNGSISLLSGVLRGRLRGGREGKLQSRPSLICQKSLGAAGCLCVEMTDRSGCPSPAQSGVQGKPLSHTGQLEGGPCLPGVSCVFQVACA